jgi:ubiquinone/menaquinone biosynthesis C-methylase UbiE
MNKKEQAVAVFDKNAQLYEDKYMDVSLYEDTLNKFCQHIAKPNAKILDVACGPGNITKFLLDKKPEFQILGIDLSPKMLELAQKNNPTATFQLLDCKEILSLNQKFDAIVAGFVLPYLSKRETLSFIKKATKMLNDKGVLYLSFMEDEYKKSAYQTSQSTGDTLFTHYHQTDYIQVEIIMNGYEKSMIHRKRSVSNGKEVCDLILIAAL